MTNGTAVRQPRLAVSEVIMQMDERDEELMRLRAAEMSSHTGPQGLTTPELLGQLAEDTKELVQMEVELATQEAKTDLSAEIDLAKGAVISAVCALLGLNMLIVAAVFALAPGIAWLVSLIVGVVLLAVAGIAVWLGWRRAEKAPLDTTRQTIEEDVQWAKQQIK